MKTCFSCKRPTADVVCSICHRLRTAARLAK